MSKRYLQFRVFLLLAPVSLFCQDSPRRGRPAEPSVEFTTTSNASQVGVDFVVGYRFTVQSSVVLTSLGAVLQGSGSQPVFGALPASMPVGLWDEAQNLLVSATVSAGDPLIGHFNYAAVTATALTPGVGYTIAGFVSKGWSVLSDVPAMVPGSRIVYGDPRSLASHTLVFPAGDQIGQRRNYFGASFLYTGGTDPVAIPGRDRRTTVGAEVKLDGSASFAPEGSSLTWDWALVSVPRGSAAALSGADSATPSLVPDRDGVYVAQLIVKDGPRHSKPSTVSITAAVAQPITRASADEGLQRALEKQFYAIGSAGQGAGRVENRARRSWLEFDSRDAHIIHPKGQAGFRLTGSGHEKRLGNPASAQSPASAQPALFDSSFSQMTLTTTDPFQNISGSTLTSPLRYLPVVRRCSQ